VNIKPSTDKVFTVQQVQQSSLNFVGPFDSFLQNASSKTILLVLRTKLHGKMVVNAYCILDKTFSLAIIASTRLTCTEVKMLKMPFFIWELFFIWIVLVFERINWVASVTILVWQYALFIGFSVSYNVSCSSKLKNATIGYGFFCLLLCLLFNQSAKKLQLLFIDSNTDMEVCKHYFWLFIWVSLCN